MRRWAIGLAVGVQMLSAGAASAANRDLTDLAAEVRQAELDLEFTELRAPDSTSTTRNPSLRTLNCSLSTTSQ